MDAPPDDVEFLVGSDHRVCVLEELSNGPRSRHELGTATGASPPTMSRILADFRDRHWIERDGRTYRLTGLGEFVVRRFEAFADAMERQRRLREVWPWLPHGIDGFDAELFTDVVISSPGPGFPYRPVERLAELISTTTTMRGFGMAVLKSGNLEAFFDRVRDGLECEYVYPPAVLEELLSWDERTVAEAAARDDYTILLHDELPVDERCGICIFDDRVSICCYDRDSGTLHSIVDTESDAMRAWATSYYERFREEARALEGVDELVSFEPRA